MDTNKNHGGGYPESCEQQEQLFMTEKTLDWLTYAGNDERKLLIQLTLYAYRDALGGTGLYNELNRRAGSIVPGSLSSALQFCEQSLVKIGAVEPESVEILRLGKIPDITTGFKATQAKEWFGLPFCGALLKWSNDYPELSLNMLGNTAGHNPNRAPITRFWTLYDLATSPETENPKSPSMSYLAEHLNITDNTRHHTVERLRQLGLVVKESAHIQNTRLFKIIQPEYMAGERKRPFDKLKPATQILFKAFREAYRQKDIWALDEFLGLLAEMNPDIDNLTFKRARTYLDLALAPSTSNLKGVVEDISGKQYEGYSKVSLRPEVSVAMSELVSIIDRFCVGDPDIMAKGRPQANKILNSPELFTKLYAKAYEKSNLANGDIALEQRVVKIIKLAGRTITTATIRNAYAEESGRNITLENISAILRKLVADGLLRVEIEPHSKLKQRNIPFYGPVI